MNETLFIASVLKMRESGVNTRIFRIYEISRFQNVGCRDSLKRPTYQENLGMAYLGSLFKALIISYTVTIFLLLIEYLYLKVVIILVRIERKGTGFLP